MQCWSKAQRRTHALRLGSQNAMLQNAKMRKKYRLPNNQQCGIFI
jgi:hypothetical protein